MKSRQLSKYLSEMFHLLSDNKYNKILIWELSSLKRNVNF